MPETMVINVPKKLKKSKYFKLMEFCFKVMHIFWSLDFGFFPSKSYKRRLFWKIVTVVAFFSIWSASCFAADLHPFGAHISFACGMFVYYFISVLFLLLINPKRTFYNYFIDFETIDLKLGINSLTYHIEKKILISLLIHLIIKSIIALAFCLHFKKPQKIAFVMLISESFVQFVPIFYSFIFHGSCCRLKKLVLFVKNTNSDVSSLQSIYAAIVDLTEEYKKTFDPTYTIVLLYHIPQSMMTVYKAVSTCFEGTSDFGVLINVLWTFEILLLVFAPALSASTLARQADKLKIVLHHKLIEIHDESVAESIEQFAHYVEVRRCRFRTYKVVPLDASLIGMVLNFCVTYVVVILQFKYR